MFIQLLTRSELLTSPNVDFGQAFVSGGEKDGGRENEE